ncbi:LOW QUALITY PROTEIN: trypsin-1 [Nilaparvata lugens]|uniref:LOW QUALITY PROTEIN: trypsin-1 n=1 Tax=Nilaparvata lugens TaxID=108931 RepID=UPI00193DD48B|nr:LOW QUALITY PROTEIN: trypsin-1 [Nilaparvata lugens]
MGVIEDLTFERDASIRKIKWINEIADAVKKDPKNKKMKKLLKDMVSEVGCGKRVGGRAGRIVGGEEAMPGEFPWLVSIRRHHKHICGGTLISSRIVLTAAHCFCRGSSVMTTEYLHVAAGEHNLNPSGDKSYTTVSRISRLILHPLYDCSKHVHDIALIVMPDALPWSGRVLPACLPSHEGASSFTNHKAIVAGWGWTDESTYTGSRSDILKKVTLEVIGVETCRSWYRSMGKKIKITDSQMCAGVEQGGKDACWADSGGPLMVEGFSRSDDDDSLLVVGVVSTGIGCARPKLPGLYTRISDYMPWISQTISQVSSK